ncbi:MAG: flippase-like domain-containing protein [Chloroflexi bacterium]|nr:flippase-like domain-containing protein [Chloroflexota bacterium]
MGYPGGISKLQHRAIIAGVVLLALVGIILILLDWPETRGAVSQAKWPPILAALGIIAVSYLCQSLSFSMINRVFGIGMAQRALLIVGFLSSAMIAAVGGVAGHSLRLLLMARRGVPAGQALAPSLFHGYLESVLFFALIPASLSYLVLTYPLSPGLTVGFAAGAAVLGAAFAMAAVVFFAAPVRGIALRLIGFVWRTATRRDMGPALQRFETSLRQGLAEIRSRWWALVPPVALIFADRAARIAVVWLCFESLGGQVDPAVLVTGFAVGVVVGVMSMVPGGMGVQEATMAGTYHLLGVPLEQAVLVALLFRLVYYMVPFGVSLVFYWYALREGRLMQAR